MLVRRTDLALAARELWQERTGAVTALPGVEAWDSAREGIPVSTVKVLDSRGEEALGKPAGCYVTLTLEGLARREEGDTLDVLGLLGNGFQMDREGRYLLVGGGIGVPPMRGCAQYTGGRSTAILGFRSKDRAILLDRFEEDCIDIQIATDDGSLGYHGFVDALVRQELEKDHRYQGVLACGPKPMLKSVAKAAAEFGVPCQVSMEERMGCGVGACLVCAVTMKDGTVKHVCKDGPVFDAEEVDWDA